METGNWRLEIFDLQYAIRKMTIEFRRGTIDDSLAVFEVFEAALLDLSRKMGVMALTGGDDPETPGEMWTRRKPLFEHLARTAHEFWVAEENSHILGYARSILRDDVLELTEFFVLPDAQSAGIGSELLRRAFPTQDAKHHLIVATTDVRAQTRYLKTGVLPRFPTMYWFRAPENVSVQTDLEFVRAQYSSDILAQMAELDRAILGLTREVDHAWFLETRKGYLYRRGGAVVGYGYHSTGAGSGPFALHDARDFAAVLTHAERAAYARGLKEIGFDIPMLNRAAVEYVLAHKYQLEPFVTLFMSDAPLGNFEKYVLTGPGIFI